MSEDQERFIAELEARQSSYTIYHGDGYTVITGHDGSQAWFNANGDKVD